MIKPEDVNKIITEAGMSEEEIAEKKKAIEWGNFMNSVQIAEKNATEIFKKALKTGGSAPRTFRVKIGLHWGEHLIKKLVEEYHRAGWENVRYNYVDKGYREPCGYWLISIKM